jgi:hypothetical protein
MFCFSRCTTENNNEQYPVYRTYDKDDISVLYLHNTPMTAMWVKQIQIYKQTKKIMEPRPIVFKEWRDTRTFSNLKSTHCTLLIWSLKLDINCKFWPNNVTISDLEWGYILCKVVKYFKNNLYFYIVMFSTDLY